MIEWIGMGFAGVAVAGLALRDRVPDSVLGDALARAPAGSHVPWPVAIRVRGAAQPFLCGADGARSVGGMELLLGPFPTRISADEAAMDSPFLVDATAAALWPGERGTAPCPIERKLLGEQRIRIDDFAASARVEADEDEWYVHVRVRGGQATMSCAACRTRAARAAG